MLLWLHILRGMEFLGTGEGESGVEWSRGREGLRKDR